MLVYSLLVAICWLVFIVYWAISALSAKRNLDKTARMRAMYVRIVIALIVIALVRLSFFQSLAQYEFISLNPIVNALGLLGCALGIALAIWARVYLGRNWGMPMSVKENPELVTTGPYSYIRHPIYTGMLLAMFGTAFVAGFWWFIFFVLFGGYFIYSATKEEKLMMKEFPDQYPAYKARTKMLIPFVF